MKQLVSKKLPVFLNNTRLPLPQKKKICNCFLVRRKSLTPGKNSYLVNEG